MKSFLLLTKEVNLRQKNLDNRASCSTEVKKEKPETQNSRQQPRADRDRQPKREVIFIVNGGSKSFSLQPVDGVTYCGVYKTYTVFP